MEGDDMKAASYLKDNSLTRENIANFLIQEKFLLTALEFHLELTEMGAKLPHLIEYFSNPANFDVAKPLIDQGQSNTGLNRYSSQTTLDSLDCARYSEDGECLADDKIALLEFELRKAKETIQSLRTNLTQAAAPFEKDKVSSNQRESKKVTSQELSIKDLKPHQKRTINFLINEYLSIMGYKMTAITFADENDDQDFENWDDIGLNIPRPPSLPQWIFENGQHIAVTESIACQTEDLPQTSSFEQEAKDLQEKVNELHNLCERQEIELQKLQRMPTPPAMSFGTPSTENKELSDDNKFVRSSTPYSESIEFGTAGVAYAKKGPHMEENQRALKEDCDTEEVTDVTATSYVEILDPGVNRAGPLGHNGDHKESKIESLEDLLESPSITEAEDKIATAISSTVPNSDCQMTEGYLVRGDLDQFPENATSNEKAKLIEGKVDEDPSISSANDVEAGNVDESDCLSEGSDTLDPQKCDRLPPLGACNDWSPQSIAPGEFIPAQKEEAKRILQTSSSRLVPEYLQDQILVVCLDSAMDVDSRLQGEVAALSLGRCNILDVLSSSLHNIAPNVILSKREELLPLLVYSISEHPSSSQREKLLHLLFNLTKRPDREQRSTILLGLVSLARILSPEKLEAELLPQCWEQLSHKHPERRLLVAQSVAVLAPYTPVSLRNSLLLSMLQELLLSEGEKDNAVIDAATASLALLVTYLDDVEKLSSLRGILVRCLETNADTLQRTEFTVLHQNFSSVLLLYFTLIQWSLDASALPQFIESILSRLKSLSQELQKDLRECEQVDRSGDRLKGTICRLIKGLELACPYLVVFLYRSLEVGDNESSEDTSFSPSPDAFSLIRELTVILNDKNEAVRCLTMVHLFMSKKKIENFSSQCRYILKTFIASVVECTTYIDASSKDIILNYIHLIRKINCCFGPEVKSSQVTPLFLSKLSVRGSAAIDGIKEDETPLTKAPFVVYTVGVLAEGDHLDGSALTDFLSRHIDVLAQCGASNAVLQMTILLLLDLKKHEETVLSALWSCVVHRSCVVRAASGPLWGLLVGQVKETDLASRVVPALVTLATDSDVSVRAASIVPLTTIVANIPSKALCDKVCLQLESVCEERSVLESPVLQVSVAQTCSFFGPKTPTQLLHELYLPCLCRAALEGVGTPQEKLKFGVALLEALTSLSSSSIPNHLVAHFILPPLNQLQKTLGSISFEHMETITFLSKEYTLRAQSSNVSSTGRIRNSFSSGSLSHLGSSLSSSVGAMGAGLPTGTGVEDVKNKMSRILTSGKAMGSNLQVKAPTLNLPTIFKRK